MTDASQEPDPPARWREWVPLVMRVAACAGLAQWFLAPLLHDAKGAMSQPAVLGGAWGLGLHVAERFALRSGLGLFGRVGLGCAAGTLLGLVMLVVAHAPAGMGAWRSLDWFADPKARGSGRAFDAIESRYPATFARLDPTPRAALAAGIRLDLDGDPGGALAHYDRAAQEGDGLVAAWAARRAERLRAR